MLLASSFLIEKMKLEHVFDVCLAVRNIKHNRKEFVTSEVTLLTVRYNTVSTNYLSNIFYFRHSLHSCMKLHLIMQENFIHILIL